MARSYVVNVSALSVSGAITLIQLKAGAESPCRLLEARFSQSGSTTSTMQRIRILRKSAAATVTAFTPLLLNPNDGAAKAIGGTSATGTNASGEGTDGDVLLEDTFNILNGWLYLPVPEDRIWVPPSGILAIKFPAAPGSALTMNGSLTFEEPC